MFSNSIISAEALTSSSLILSFDGPQLREKYRVGSEIIVGHDLRVEGVVTNNMNHDVSFVYIVQIKDSEGLTLEIITKNSWIAENERSYVSVPWVPQLSCDCQIETFLWSDLHKPQVFAPNSGTFYATVVDFSG
ncbi:MAG: hypothetical protein HMLIMOIP_001864 [Candidatus Nitrosomirales archaeon]|jgi:hypothetical protein